MKKILIMALFAATVFSGCGGNTDSQVLTPEQQISLLKTQLSEVQTELLIAQTQAENDGIDLSVAITSLTQVETTLAQLETQTATQETVASIATASNQMLVLQSLVASLTASSQNLVGRCNTVMASIVTLTTQLATAQSQVASLTTQLATSQSSNSDLTSQLTAAEAQVTDLTNQVATLTATATILQSQLDAANITIASRNATIASLNSTIASLNATITGMLAMPVPINLSTTSVVVNASVSVTVTFPDSSQDGKQVVFSSPGGGSFTPATVAVSSGAHTATTQFSATNPGTYNINAVVGIYCGGATVTATAVPMTTYSLTGNIALNGTALQNVAVVLTGTAIAATTTDASGAYTFSGLANGSYTVTPKLSGYSFMPASRTLTVTSVNVVSLDFVDVLTKTYSCAGTLSPLGRWCDNQNGTIRDMTTGLLWLQDTNWMGTQYPWWSDINSTVTAFDVVSTLKSGVAISGTVTTLADNSFPGYWRLPTQQDFYTLQNGVEKPTYDSPYFFTHMNNGNKWWSSTVNAFDSTHTWALTTPNGAVSAYSSTDSYNVWPVHSDY